MLELVKVLCNILGYDLNPDAEKDKDGKDGAMDDQVKRGHGANERGGSLDHIACP